MPIMTFNREQANRLLQASLNTSKPIHVVKDQGAYCMVFGSEKHGTKNVVEYQPKYDPEKVDADILWARCRRDFGGDDFGESVLDPTKREHYTFMMKLIDSTAWTQLRVHVNKMSLKVSIK